MRSRLARIRFERHIRDHSYPVVRIRTVIGWPLSERCRSSRSSTDSPAGVAADSVTTISPTPAWEQRCAVTLTVSPRDLPTAEHGPDVRRARVDGHSERNPRIVSRPVPRSLKEAPGRIDGPARVVRSGDPRNEQTDGLVANELVEERVVLDQHVRGRPVEPVHQVAELRGTHRAGQTARASDVGEHQGQLDLSADAFMFPQLRHAEAADVRVLLPGREAEAPHDPSSRPTERRPALLAPRTRRDESEDRTGIRAGMHARQEGAPLLLWTRERRHGRCALCQPGRSGSRHSG